MTGPDLWGYANASGRENAQIGLADAEGWPREVLPPRHPEANYEDGFINACREALKNDPSEIEYLSAPEAEAATAAPADARTYEEGFRESHRITWQARRQALQA